MFLNYKIHFEWVWDNTIENKPVEIAKVVKTFGADTVLDGIDLSIEPGTVFGLVGLNGAGKTTFIRIMLGLMRQTSGSCRLLGLDPQRYTGELFRRMGVVLEHNGFYGNLSVMDNLRFFGRAKGISERSLKKYLQQFWAGTDIVQKKGKTKFFSRGQKMQCGLCRAFLGWPDVFLLDEPAVALDVSAYDHFCSLVRHAKENGAVVFISSHQFDTIEELCDRIGILEKGRLTMLDRESPVQQWIVQSSTQERVGEIITEFASGKPTLDNGVWSFAVESPQRKIPMLVAELVREGFSVYKVQPMSDSVKETVRRYYSQNGKGGGYNESIPE
ncbi:MAG: ABC transporter ATP-binding protein [Chitinivibrionales bacterium]